MNIFISILLIFIGLSLDTTVSRLISIGYVRPYFLFIFLIYISMDSRIKRGTLFGFIGGFLLDCFSPRYLGAQALIFSIVGFFLSNIANKIDKTKVYAQFLVLFLSSLFYLTLYSLIMSVKSFPEILVLSIIPSTFYTGAAGVLVFQILNRLCQKQG